MSCLRQQRSVDCAPESLVREQVLTKTIMQVYWLLTAIAQDQPKNKAVGELRDNCERAALEGSWVSIRMSSAQPAHASRPCLVSCQQHTPFQLVAGSCVAWRCATVTRIGCWSCKHAGQSATNLIETSLLPLFGILLTPACVLSLDTMFVST